MIILFFRSHRSLPLLDFQVLLENCACPTMVSSDVIYMLAIRMRTKSWQTLLACVLILNACVLILI